MDGPLWWKQTINKSILYLRTVTFDSMCVRVNGCCMYNCACLCLKHPRRSRLLVYLRELFTIQPTRSTRSSSCLTLSQPPVTSQSPTGAISITAPRLWNDPPPELTISLPPPPSLCITTHHLHPPPLSVTPGPQLKIKISSL